jgi:endonuclease/exonuclease/phosphatase family metal-dependent hydrolase
MVLIGTWNLENLFRPGGEFGPKDEATYDAKLDALAATIRAETPDVLAVQEVGDPAALADLAARLGPDWQSVTAQHFEDDHPIRVGVLSRRPVRVSTEQVDLPPLLTPVRSGDRPEDTTTTMGRGALAVQFDGDQGTPVTLVVCHLKSKLLHFPPTASGRPRFNPHDEGERARYTAYALLQRAAEATAVRGLVDTLLAGHGTERAVVVLGDLNDEPGAATTQLLLGPPGSELGTPGFSHPDKGDAWRLWNLASLIPEVDRYSRVYEGHHELIDHILVSHLAVHAVGDVQAVHTAALPSVTEDPTTRRDAPASDHSPLFASLDL